MTRPFGFCLTFQKHSEDLNIWLSSTTDMACQKIEMAKEAEGFFTSMGVGISMRAWGVKAAGGGRPAGSLKRGRGNRERPSGRHAEA
jgi:hypothetical protein